MRLPTQKILLFSAFLLLLFNLLAGLYLGSLYQKPKTPPQKTPSQLQFYLPVKSFKKIVEKQGYLLFYLPAQTPLFPALAGMVVIGEAAIPERFQIIKIVSPAGYQLSYFYKGTVKTRTTGLVSPDSGRSLGEAAASPAATISLFDQAHLVLSLKNSQGEKVPLTVTMFSPRP